MTDVRFYDGESGRGPMVVETTSRDSELLGLRHSVPGPKYIPVRYCQFGCVEHVRLSLKYMVSDLPVVSAINSRAYIALHVSDEIPFALAPI